MDNLQVLCEKFNFWGGGRPVLPQLNALFLFVRPRCDGREPVAAVRPAPVHAERGRGPDQLLRGDLHHPGSRGNHDARRWGTWCVHVCVCVCVCSGGVGPGPKQRKVDLARRDGSRRKRSLKNLTLGRKNPGPDREISDPIHRLKQCPSERLFHVCLLFSPSPCRVPRLLRGVERIHLDVGDGETTKQVKKGQNNNNLTSSLKKNFQFFIFLIIIFLGEITVGVLVYFKQAPYQVDLVGFLFK